MPLLVAHTLYTLARGKPFRFLHLPASFSFLFVWHFFTIVGNVLAGAVVLYVNATRMSECSSLAAGHF